MALIAFSQRFIHSSFEHMKYSINPCPLQLIVSFLWNFIDEVKAHFSILCWFSSSFVIQIYRSFDSQYFKSKQLNKIISTYPHTQKICPNLIDSFRIIKNQWINTFKYIIQLNNWIIGIQTYRLHAHV